MNQDRLYLIGEVAGFTPQIGRLVSMMTSARSATLAAVSGLTVNALDYLHDAQSNSIGALLEHIAAAEVGYQAATLHARDLTEDERRAWGAAFTLDERSRREIRGHDLAYYLQRLDEVRATTLDELRRRDDGWLERETTFGNGTRVNNYFKWFHVFGHEINHRGQIRWLRRRAAAASAHGVE
jgi:uncharacterized damage-inducible protein DinB